MAWFSIVAIMTFAEWFTLAAVCFAGASSPGPSLALLIRSVVRDGHLAGIVFGVAHGIGILLYSGIVTVGLGAVMVAAPHIATLLEITGIAFLFWLATGMIRAGLSRQAVTGGTSANPSMPLSTHARDGFMIVFLNPKVAVFFLAVFSQFLTLDQGASVRLLMVLTAFFIDTGWYVLVALIIAMPKILRVIELRERQLELMIGIVLCLICINLVWRLLSGS
jgi:threonine/homoserine/homoserine lactone efflux protein